MKKLLLILTVLTFAFTSCTENYSNGKRTGFITKLTKKGIIWNSWEGELNQSQTGMTSNAQEFDFSIDNDQDGTELLRVTLDSAVTLGWKVTIVYHETKGKNWFHNRGETSHFVTDVIVEDKHPMQNIFNTK